MITTLSLDTQREMFISSPKLRFLAFVGVCTWHSTAAMRGLKKKKGDKKKQNTSFDMCRSLLPDQSNNTFKLEETCFDDFWSNEDPWDIDGPFFSSFLPACSCAMLANDCYNEFLGKWSPMYQIALDMDLSQADSVEIANTLIPEECISFVSATVTIAGDLPSND